jgi:hypothetical protein
MKLFAYTTRSTRATEPLSIAVSKRAIVHQFRLINDRNQVKLLGTAFFRSDKSDKAPVKLGKDALLPLTELANQYECTQIQYFQDSVWHTLTV